MTDDAVEADLAAFPGWLDRIDDWIEGGVLGGEPPNAADFQIASALGLAMTLDDLRPAIESRPGGPAHDAPGARTSRARFRRSCRPNGSNPSRRAPSRLRPYGLSAPTRVTRGPSRSASAIGVQALAARQRQLGIQLKKRRQDEEA